MSSTHRRSKASFGLVAFGATLIVAALASGNTNALSTPAGNGTFTLQNATASEGTNCNGPGWLFEATGGAEFQSITLNSETGTNEQGPNLKASTHFIQLPAGRSLSDLTTSGSTAKISFDGGDSSVTSFVLASVCSPSAPPPSSTEPPPPSSTEPPPPSSTEPPPPSSSAPSTTQPTNNETTTTSGSESAAPTTTPGGATATTVAQLAETGSTDRLVVVLGLLFMSLGSVLYLVSRPTAAN